MLIGMKTVDLTGVYLSIILFFTTICLFFVALTKMIKYKKLKDKKIKEEVSKQFWRIFVIMIICLISSVLLWIFYPTIGGPDDVTKPQWESIDK